jgi:hypothetical protein
VEFFGVLRYAQDDGEGKSDGKNEDATATAFLRLKV